MIRLWDEPVRKLTLQDAKRLTDEHNGVVAAYLDSLRVARALADGWAAGGCINAGAEVCQQARAVMRRFNSEFGDQTATPKPTDTKTVLLKVAELLEAQAKWYNTRNDDSHGINTAMSIANQDVALAIRDALE